MKKTRFEKFMASVTKDAMKDERLDTFEDHLKFVRLSIEMQLISTGQTEEQPKKREQTQSNFKKVSGILGSVKRGLIWTWAKLKKIYAYLITGNNFMIIFIGLLLLYAALITAFGMI